MAFHPSAKVLEDYGLGKLDHATAETVSYHLERCPECLQTVANFSGDSFLDQVRDARFATVAPGAAPSDPGLPPELRDHPHYEIIRELGRGGMGVVYLARQRLMGRAEVLKLISARLLNEPGFTERFLREIESIARLDHPNIVKAHSAFQAGKLLVFAMEYIDGETLAEVVKKQGPLSVVDACFYACQVARGLQHAFERGMIHRDIKPQNLMLAKDGKRRIVKILDFGLAKPASASASAPARRNLTRTGYTLGTPHYMAPEQIEDAGKVDIRADLYSLGCTLYYLLSGRPPFEGNSDIKLFDAHRRSLPKPMQTIRADVPAELAAVIAKLLQKDPAGRYQTPGEAAKALEPFFKAAAKPAPPAPPTDKPQAQPDTWVQPQPLPPTMIEGKQTIARGHAKASSGLPRGLVVLIGTAAVGMLFVCTPVLLWLVYGPRPQDRNTQAPADKGVNNPQAPPDKGVNKDKDRPIPNGQQPAPQWMVPGLGLEMVWIPPGTFLMGTPPAEIAALKKEYGGTWFDAEGPQHEVEITKGFYLGKYEVTQGEYASVMGQNPSWFKPDGDGKASVAGMDTSRFPVEKVSWDQAKEFCRNLTDTERQAGRLPQNEEYHLPTEAEWEYACRGRQTKVYEVFHYGNSLSSEQANFNGEFPFGGAPKGKYLRRTAKVGSYQPNGFGLYDMHGNVWEWCEDYHEATTYSRGNCKDPRGPPGGSSRVMRGGSWDDDSRCCRSAYRSWNAPGIRGSDLGFRLARSSVR